MASNEQSKCRAMAIVMCATSVVIAAFLGARFLHKRRRQRGDLQHQKPIGGTINDAPSSPSSSGDSEAAPEYEVFLSFRGSDNRKTFTDHLYNGLKDAGFCTFRDDEELRVGEEIGPELMKSIKQSKIGMPIFSKDYASSKWCLMEVAEMVKSMKEGKQLIMPIFYNVSVDDVQHQTGSYADSFAQHEKRFCQEKVQTWRDALREVVKLKGLELAKVANGKEGAFIKLVVAKVIGVLKKSYLEMGDVLIGIEDRAEELVKKLQVGRDEVRFIGIWGMGGIGKTTLAKYVYNQIMDKFECHSFLKNIRETARYPKGLQSLQSKLVADILRRDKDDYFNVEEGVGVLKERLRNKKALVLLDDVDHIDQLKALAANASWFGRGSRIIITTRDKKLLDLSNVKDYEVEFLNKDQAFELFCRHAFGDKSPRSDLVEQAWKIVNITGRLPLALEVTGSFLSVYVGNGDMWHGMIEKLKRKPDMDVRDKLMISYESLEPEQQEIFLDIACFFIGMDVRLLIPMWNDAKFSPEVGIEILRLKSLIKIGDDHAIWMHDQLRDLGRSIVNDSDNEPGRRSRIWDSEDAFSVLIRGQGTYKVDAIHLEGHHFSEEDNLLSDTMLRKMPNLKILELGNAQLHGNFHCLFYELRWLSWHRGSISPPENLVLQKLIVLDLSRSFTDESWIGWNSIKIGWKLKVLNLSNCPFSKTPNFSAFPSLEILIMERCEQLESIDPSVGVLKNLILLNLRKCRQLKNLPEQLGSMESLTELLIDETGVSQVPISGGMRKLEVLSAIDCKYLREVSASIGSVKNLKSILLKGCSELRELPDSIVKLTLLVQLDLSQCSQIKRLPDFLQDMHYLVSLRIEGTLIARLPANLGYLKKLEVLDASWQHLEEDREIPDDVLNLSSLRGLKLYYIKRLPESLSVLSCLQTLYLGCCQNLQSLPELPSCLVALRVEASSKLASPNLANLVNLKRLIMIGGFELKENCLSIMRKLEDLTLFDVKIRSLPEEMSSFPRLKILHLRECRDLCNVPRLPPSLTRLRFLLCAPFETFPDLSNLKQLLELTVSADRPGDIPKEIHSLENFNFMHSNEFEKAVVRAFRVDF